MNLKKTWREFATVFAVILVTVTLVTFLWNLIGHGKSIVDWETSFRFATIFGVFLTWVKLRGTNEKQVLQKTRCREKAKRTAY